MLSDNFKYVDYRDVYFFIDIRIIQLNKSVSAEKLFPDYDIAVIEDMLTRVYIYDQVSSQPPR